DGAQFAAIGGAGIGAIEMRSGHDASWRVGATAATRQFDRDQSGLARLMLCRLASHKKKREERTQMATAIRAADAATPTPAPAGTHVDVLIVGAGISGIGSAFHLQQQCPGKSYAILEMKESFGGTWDTHKYPGVRSD